MDTQRLILFVIFSFSALFLWEAWQREHRPPVPPSAQAPATQPGIEAPVPAGPAAPAVPGATPVVAAGEKLAIKTDLYAANVETLGAVISDVALSAHRDAQDESKPY